MRHTTLPPDTRAWVVHVALAEKLTWEAESQLEEAVSLASTLTLDVVGTDICHLRVRRPSTLMGKGWVDQLGRNMKSSGATLLVVNHPLSPVQQRNLEKSLQCKVIDRTGLILEIFAHRARTAEGRLQVELALLSYQKSRLVRCWTHLERQRGGGGFMSGPGESQLELDKRLIATRMHKLRQDIKQIQKTRFIQRQARHKVPYPTVVLVGYTNAGKSTLFNALTQADVLADDLLFATLDPAFRKFHLPSGRKIIFSDTVGFISDLPTSLVTAFHATLEEVKQADLLLHVQDISHPHREIQHQSVLNVLDELGVNTGSESHILNVWNKMDQCEALPESLPPHAILVSATEGKGIPALLEKIDAFFRRRTILVTLDVPREEGKVLAWLHEHSEIQRETKTETHVRLEVFLTPKLRERFKTLFPTIKVLPLEHDEANDSY